MRAKQLWKHAPVPSQVKLVWDRITLSRLTIAYFTFSIVHFVIQFSFQIKAFTINADAAHLLKDIMVQGNAVNQSLPILRGDTLHMCSWVPGDLNLDGDSCPVVWSGTKRTNTQTDNNQSSPDSSNDSVSLNPSVSVVTSVSVFTSTLPTLPTPTSSSVTSSSIGFSSTPVQKTAVDAVNRPQTQTITVFVKPTPGIFSSIDDGGEEGEDEFDHRLFGRGVPRVLAFQEDGLVKINISGMDTPVILDSSCVWSLNWPESVLKNTKREDIVFIGFQFWVLGMSIVAILNESIPHILASLLTHMMATSWAGFQIQHTADFRTNFTRVITNGACSGNQLLPNYWQERGTAELASLAFNILALLVSSFLTWKLIKSFGWQTFKRVGASLTINRIYKIVLTLSITIQLCFFFVGVTVSLWLDQLFNSAIGDLATWQILYKVTSFVTLALLIPWLMTGWFAARRELRVPMFVFLLLGILYLAGWGVMFFSTTFRWTFVTWKFFSIMASASVILVAISLVLGVICRYNFGKGLLLHLNAEQTPPGDDFEYYKGSDMEKVAFPSNEKPIPTYSATFESDPIVPPVGRTRGPRFFDSLAAPFETVKTTPITLPPSAYTVARKASDGSSRSGTSGVTRSDTRSSDKSIGSLASFYSYSDKGHTRTDSQKRWVIE